MNPNTNPQIPPATTGGHPSIRIGHFWILRLNGDWEYYHVKDDVVVETRKGTKEEAYQDYFASRAFIAKGN